MSAASTTDREAVVAAPKSLLHDHLDGGLRVDTILEISDEIGHTPRLPTTERRHCRRGSPPAQKHATC
ncbi:MAG: hypothetical protein EB111_06265 [Actinobacteria bacterium]|nr:hypothetical protein [Actinomycetota bacterium]